MDFHQARERNPSFFYSRLVNKLWYFKGGFQQFMKGEFRDFNQHVRLECDGEEVILPPSVEGIILLNIGSFGGGSDLWGSAETVAVEDEDEEEEEPEPEEEGDGGSGLYGPTRSEGRGTKSGQISTQVSGLPRHTNTARGGGGSASSCIDNTESPASSIFDDLRAEGSAPRRMLIRPKAASVFESPLFTASSPNGITPPLSPLKITSASPPAGSTEASSPAGDRGDSPLHANRERSYSSAIDPLSPLPSPKRRSPRGGNRTHGITSNGASQSRAQQFSYGNGREKQEHVKRGPRRGRTRSGGLFTPPSCSDGLIEVIGITGVVSLGLAQVRMGGPIRLCQCRHVRISTSKRLPMQVDGEPKWQVPGVIEVSDPSQAFLLSLKHHADLLHGSGGSSSIDELHHHTIHGNAGEGVVDGVIASVFDWATEKGVIDTQQRNVLLEEMARKLEQTRAMRKYLRDHGSFDEDEDDAQLNVNWNSENDQHAVLPVGRSTTATIQRRRPAAITTKANQQEQDGMMGYGAFDAAGLLPSC
jgi:hypothetical protein